MQIKGFREEEMTFRYKLNKREKYHMAMSKQTKEVFVLRNSENIKVNDLQKASSNFT